MLIRLLLRLMKVSEKHDSNITLIILMRFRKGILIIYCPHVRRCHFTRIDELTPPAWLTKWLFPAGFDEKLLRQCWQSSMKRVAQGSYTRTCAREAWNHRRPVATCTLKLYYFCTRDVTQGPCRADYRMSWVECLAHGGARRTSVTPPPPPTVRPRTPNWLADRRETRERNYHQQQPSEHSSSLAALHSHPRDPAQSSRNHSALIPSTPTPTRPPTFSNDHLFQFHPSNHLPPLPLPLASPPAQTARSASLATNLAFFRGSLWNSACVRACVS